MKLHGHIVESAHRYFKLAVEHKFIQGRRTDLVVAACMYLTCRIEKTPHMLLDFADILEVNVFTLGSVYLKLVHNINVTKPPFLDPTLYILRFANKLNFGERTHDVSRTALRLVQRMSRDWIQVGRRPSGICGAALLVAARLHHFHRTQREVVRVVKVCDATLRQRLDEFEATPTASLTTDEWFKGVELTQEADPPAYSRSKGQMLDRARQAAVAAMEATEATEAADGAGPAAEGGFDVMDSTTESGVTIDASVDAELREVLASLSQGLAADDSAAAGAAAPASSSAAARAGLAAAAEVLGLVEPEQVVVTAWTDPGDDGRLSELDDDDEVVACQLSEAEAAAKGAHWEEEHRDYLQRQKEKKRQAEEKQKEQGDKAAAPPRKKKKQEKKPSTTGEAVAQMVQQRKPSKKINYDRLKALGISHPMGGTWGAEPPPPPPGDGAGAAV